MTRRSVVPCLLVLATTLPLLQTRTSQAVPAFARREGAECQMCHFRLPELNEDGHAYLRRGLREEPGGMAPEMAMDMGTKMTATAPVASTVRPLGEALPLEWRNYLTVMGHHTYEARAHETAGIQAGMIDSWIGGPLDRHWSGVADFAFDIENGGVEVEQAYAQFNTDWSARFASLRFGQVLPFAILFNGGGAAMPLSTPVVLETPSGERNPWAPASLLRGVEIGMVDLPRWNAYAGIGRPQIGSITGAEHTDAYASAEYLIGNKGNAVSGYLYKGRIAASSEQSPLDYERVALFANVYGPGAKGVLGLLWGNDRPDGGESVRNSGWFLLGEVLLSERWAGYARYDYANREVPVGDAEVTDGPTLGVSFWAQTQVRLTLESRFLKVDDGTRDGDAIAELMWVF